MKRALSCHHALRPQYLHPHRTVNRRLLLLTSLLAMTASGTSSALSSLIPGRVNNYSECVIRQLQPNTGTIEIDAIVGNCRDAFPGASQRNLLDPRSVQSCYRRHQDRVAHRPAAKALFIACQDYFRQS